MSDWSIQLVASHASGPKVKPSLDFGNFVVGRDHATSSYGAADKGNIRGKVRTKQGGAIESGSKTRLNILNIVFRRWRGNIKGIRANYASAELLSL